MRRPLLSKTLFAAATTIAASGIIGCASTGAEAAASTDEDTDATAGELADPSGAPLACADPTVISTHDAGQTFYVFCTSMHHVWKTTDWTHFTDERASLTFAFGAMHPAGKQTGSWWAPSIAWDAAHARYVMWVSVLDDGVHAMTTRSLAVFHAPDPLGPWTYAGLGIDASASGQMLIDPMIFRDHDGQHYLYWKRYGGGLSSSIMGARLDASLTGTVASTHTEITHGYGGPGTWEDNVRENPAMWRHPTTGRYHLLYSGAHWADGSYATGHALSTCGPLCGFDVSSTGQGGIPQVVQAKNDPHYAFGGPGGATWVEGKSGVFIVYAAASRSAHGDKTRYLHRDKISWFGHDPYVDTPHHEPSGG